MMFINSVILLILTVIGFIYFYVKKIYSYWEKRNVKSLKPIFPYGNLKGIGSSLHPAFITQKIYNAFVDTDVIAGIYLFTKPGILILDPELTKNVLVKDFNHFRNRGFYYNEKDDPLTASLFAIEDEKWRNLRIKLTPTFTSGKMKLMFQQVLNISNILNETIQSHLNESDEIEIKDFVSRFSTDVIGSCAFGIDCNSLKDPNAEFRKYGKMTFEPASMQFKIFFGNTFPNLARKLGVKFLDSAISKFFLNVVRETINFRQTNNVERIDFMHFLLDLEKNAGSNIEEAQIEKIAATAFLFFVAGFETSSSTINYCLYELARHQDIQNKVREEINKNIKEFDGITYDGLQKLSYMEKTINETLRKYPAVDNIFRVANDDYKVPGTNHIIEKNTTVFIPIYGFNHNPKIYPNPEVFDPERFNEENMKKRHQFSFLPFGEGPRVCIGMRFGLMQTKLGILTIIKNYRVSFCDKTPGMIEFIPSSPIMAPKIPIVLKIEKL